MNKEEGLRQSIMEAGKRIEEDSNYSARRHFNTGSTFKIIHYSVGILAAFLSAFAAFTIYLQTGVSLLIGGTFAFISAGLMAVLTILGPGELSSIHFRAGSDYLKLKKDAKHLVTVKANILGNKELETELDILRSRLSDLDSSSGTLWTPRRAYNKARRDIKEGTTSYETDTEKSGLDSINE